MSKIPFGIVFIEAGNTISFRPVFENAPSPIVLRVDGKVSFVNCLLLEKASFPISSTPSGTEKSVIPVSARKASTIFLVPGLKLTVTKFLLPLKAYFPVTKLLPATIEVNDSIFPNAKAPIFSIADGKRTVLRLVF